jgi:threonine dehydrogenase-like Zn-dependent dehydrogenase
MESTMQAIVWYGGSDLRREVVPAPVATPDQAVVNVILAGVCGSDLHPIRGHHGPRRPPLILGHEVVGTLDGSDERYAVFPLATCGACAACRRGEENLCRDRGLLGLDRPGVFAEQVAVSRRALIPVPGGLDDRLAILVEPLATSVSALRIENLRAGDRILVIGCGPIGLLAIHAARRGGLHVVAVEPLASRRELAARLGAEDVHEDLAAVEGLGADAVIDAVGIGDTATGGIAAVRRGGSIAVLGLGAEEGSVPLAKMVRDGVRIRGHYAYTAHDFEAALELLASDPPAADWLTLIGLEDTAAGIRDLIQHPEATTKVVLRVGSA